MLIIKFVVTIFVFIGLKIYELIRWILKSVGRMLKFIFVINRKETFRISGVLLWVILNISFVVSSVHYMNPILTESSGDNIDALYVSQVSLTFFIVVVIVMQYVIFVNRERIARFFKYTVRPWLRTIWEFLRKNWYDARDITDDLLDRKRLK